MKREISQSPQIDLVDAETGYFSQVSDITCPFCKRPLLYDPREPATREISQLKSIFSDWVFEDLENRIGFLYDGDLWISPEIGPCHEACYKDRSKAD